MDNKMQETIELLTRAEAARYLNICLSTLDKLINDRKFYGKVNIGRRVFIDKGQLNKYIQENMYYLVKSLEDVIIMWYNRNQIVT